tara:strand:- start:1753 stop:2358 length:606 start_codon:yes stop_codon:yes gene_type:complete
MQIKKKIKLVAFFGPDGSGKSLLVNELLKLFKSKNISCVKFHWRPRILPTLNKNFKNLKFNKPNNLKQRNIFFSFFLYIYFFLDFKVNEFFIKKKNQKKIILYERYYYDVLIHPRRYKLTNIYWLGKFFSKLLKKPDYSILLYGNAKSIYLRKKELDTNEIIKQMKLYNKIIPKLSNIIKLNTTKNRIFVLKKFLFRKLTI